MASDARRAQHEQESRIIARHLSALCRGLVEDDERLLNIVAALAVTFDRYATQLVLHTTKLGDDGFDEAIRAVRGMVDAFGLRVAELERGRIKMLQAARAARGLQ